MKNSVSNGMGALATGFQALPFFLVATFVLASALFASCSPSPPVGSVTSTAAVEAPIDSPSTAVVSEPPPLEALGPGRLDVIQGAQVQPGEELLEFFVYTELGSFPIALRRSLAPESVDALAKRILKGDYAGQRLVEQGENFIVVAPKKLWGQKLKNRNRIQPAEALVFISPEGVLGFTTGPTTAVQSSWTCVGQIQVLPGLLAQWRKTTEFKDVVRSIGNPAN